MALLIFFLVAPIVLGFALMILMDKKSKVTLSKKLWIVFVLLLVSFLPFTYDIIMTNIFSVYYCNTAPNPKTHIGKKVEYPVSIYWEDNVYPGFSKEDRELMIQNYLDGVHLQIMALNAPDGSIHLYHREVSRQQYDDLQKQIVRIWQQIKQIEARPRKQRSVELNQKLVDLYEHKNALASKTKSLIENTPLTHKTYTKSSMPALNYTVTFDEVPLPKLARKFLYSDETKITENSTGEVIAYNRRYMRFFYKLLPDIALGNRYYWQVPMCGDRYELHLDAFDMLKWRLQGRRDHKIALNNYLYTKHIEGGR